MLVNALNFGSGCFIIKQILYSRRIFILFYKNPHSCRNFRCDIQSHIASWILPAYALNGCAAAAAAAHQALCPSQTPSVTARYLVKDLPWRQGHEALTQTFIRMSRNVR